MKRANRFTLWAALAAGLAGGFGARAAQIELPARTPAGTFAPGIAESLLPDLPARDGASDWIAFGDEAESLPVTLDDPPVSDGVWVPILGVMLAGLAWRYFQSPAYSALYDRLFGPLREY
jgi:hypothetical protein